MGQYDSKYKIIIESLKKYDLYDDLWNDMIYLSRESQVKNIYDIVYRNAVHSDTILKLSHRDYWLRRKPITLDGYQSYYSRTYITNINYWKIKYYINGIYFEIYFNYQKYYDIIEQNMIYVFIDIIHKKYERLLENYLSFPNIINNIVSQYL